MDKDTFTLQAIRQDLIDNNLQAKAIIQVSIQDWRIGKLKV